MAVCGRVLIVFAPLLVACSRLRIVCGCLWSFVVVLLVIGGRLWSFCWWSVVVACFSNYNSKSYIFILPIFIWNKQVYGINNFKLDENF